MFRILLILVLVLLVAVGILLSGQLKTRGYMTMLGKLLRHSVPEMDIQTAISTNDAVFLDAREQEEFEVSHIRNAIPVGYTHFDPETVSHLPRDTSIIVYCSVGYRSEKIAEKLLDNGFTRVSNLYGGIFEWINRGHEVVCHDGSTDRVHAYNKVWGVWLNRGTKVY